MLPETHALQLTSKIQGFAKDSRKTLRYLQEISGWPSQVQLQVIFELRACQVQVNTFHYNALMNSLTKLQSWPLALVQFSSLRCLKLQVDLPSFNSLATPCDWSSSLWIRHCSLHHSFSYNLIGAVASISNCASLGLWQRSLEILETLVKRSLQMDEKPQSALINACEKASNWLGAFRTLEWMLWSQARPNQISFNALSSACGGRWWRSLWAFQATEKPNGISCNALLSCCEKGAQWCQALGSLDASYSAVDVVSFNCGISACGQAGRWEYCLDLFQQLRGRDEISSTAAISACDQKRKWQAVLRVLEAMSLGRLSPNQICLNAAISGFESGSQWQRAIQGVMRMMDLSIADEQSFASGIRACMRVSQSYWSLRLLGLMDGLGLPVNEICRSESVESCQKSGEAVQDAVEQMEVLQRSSLRRIKEGLVCLKFAAKKL